jgi:hypothetical protein
VGNNAFFVESNQLDKIETKLPNLLSAHMDWRVRESRDKNGNLNYKDFQDSRKEIANCTVLDIQNAEVIRVSQI